MSDIDHPAFGFMITAMTLIQEVVQKERQAQGLRPLTQVEIDSVFAKVRPDWDKMTSDLRASQRLIGPINRLGGIRNDQSGFLQARATLALQRIREEVAKL